MAQEIESLQVDYLENKDPETRAGLKSIILHKLAVDGTWVMMTDPKGNAVATYFEPKVTTLPYKLPAYLLVSVPPGY